MAHINAIGMMGISVAIADHQPRKKIRNSILIMLGLLLACAIGLYLLGGPKRTAFDAIWLSVNILTTVGDAGEKLSTPERWWAMVMMLAGVLTIFYVGSTVVAFIVDGEIRRVLGRRKLQNAIDRLNGHFIVCGFGRMGEALCDSLAERNTPFVVLETDPTQTALADEKGYLYLLGDATLEQTLTHARIDNASGLATCLSTDADNIFVTLTARDLNSEMTIISRSDNKRTVHKFKRAGADRVVCSPVLSAHKIMRMLLHPAVDELMDMAVSGPDLEVSKVKLEQLPKSYGKTLRDLALPKETGLMIISVVNAKGDRTFNPPPDTTLLPTDEIIVIGQSGGLEKLLVLLGEE